MDELEQAIIGFHITRDEIRPLSPENRALIANNVIEGWSWYQDEGVLRRHTDKEVMAGKAAIIGSPFLAVDTRCS